MYDIDGEENLTIRKLVEYYKTEFKFEEPNHLSILKPYYDYDCWSLIQPIGQLKDRRKTSWIQHSDMDED